MNGSWLGGAALVALASVCGCSAAPTAPVSSSPAGGAPATLVLRGGQLRTMDPARPQASALAVRDGEIVAVGSDDEVRGWIGPATVVLELGGREVTPGLVDAHCHLAGLGADLERISVRDQASEQATAAFVADRAASRPAGEWILGRGWDQNRWPGQRFPTRASLDAHFPDRPVVLERIDGHALWLNGAALALAKIDARTQDPPGGKILRDARGEPTGVLVDNAAALAERAMPAPTRQTRERWIRAAAAKVVALGVTGVHEMGIDGETAEAYRALASAGALPLRVYAFSSPPADPERLRREPPRPPVGRFAMRGVKLFADGALGSRGARLYEDYQDDAGNRGIWVTDPATLTRWVDAAVAGGWQVAVHAIGDAGNGAVLDAFGAVSRGEGRDLRLRIEHAQVLAERDWPRLVATRAIASMQPTHATSDMPWASARLGPARLGGAYAWRTVVARGVPLAAGSDFPVEQPGPLLGIYAAVTRQDSSGAPPGGWLPEQRLSLDEAVAAFTRGSAYAEGAELRRGMLRPGFDADLTVLDGALRPDRSLLDLQVAFTVVGGDVVYRKP